MTTLASMDVTIDSRRRPALPARLMEEAGMRPGDHVRVRVAGAGRLVIETAAASREAARDRIRAKVEPISVDRDVVAEVRAGRDEDNRVADENAARRGVLENEEHSAQRGEALLAALGL